MTDPAATELARTLAVRRKRDTFTCEVCGEPFEAWARKTQPARTCSPNCRAKLFRRTRKLVTEKSA